VRWKERNFNADAYVTFALNPDGSIERMKMQPISTETDFSYDFQDLNFHAGEETQIADYKPKLVFVDGQNKITSVKK
jgi:hypothetical protein